MQRPQPDWIPNTLPSNTLPNVILAQARIHSTFDVSRSLINWLAHDRKIMDKPSYVCILATAPHGTLYTGVTAHIIKRTWQHKSDVMEGFTKSYGIHMLVWYEIHISILESITREKQIKHWKRAWKVKLISTQNPEWRDLYNDVSS